MNLKRYLVRFLNSRKSANMFHDTLVSFAERRIIIMKKTKTLTITILALFLLAGCKNDITTKNKDVTTKNSDMLTIYNDENISFGLDEKNKIKQWAFDNDGTFDYFMNDIENWGDNPQKSRKNCDINYVSDDMSNESVETIIAIIDTSFSIDKYSMRDSVWINLNEIENDGLDNDRNGYVDDIRGYNFCELNPFIDNDAVHGTAILGLMCAKPEINGYKNIIGNYNIKIMCVKALDDVSESASIDRVIEAIKYAETNGANVCCLSFGTIIYNKKFHETIKNSKMLFVVASGNDGYNIDEEIPFYPASFNESNIITVASMRSDGKFDCTSNYGTTSVDLVAPGTDVVSVTPSGRFSYFSGTSYAVPFVGGTAAKIYNLNENNISSSDVKKIVIDNVKVSKELGVYVKSSGMLNEKAAVENCFEY